jgi:lipopolysaccharide/colanic/teichoic acid biosynthesis glycosyltransferase
MTGLLQVSGRSGIIDFDHWVNHDIDYIDNWSLWLDMKIIFKTIFVVLSMRGAK